MQPAGSYLEIILSGSTGIRLAKGTPRFAYLPPGGIAELQRELMELVKMDLSGPGTMYVAGCAIIERPELECGQCFVMENSPGDRDH